jgi:hypothetical protein
MSLRDWIYSLLALPAVYRLFGRVVLGDGYPFTWPNTSNLAVEKGFWTLDAARATSYGIFPTPITDTHPGLPSPGTVVVFRSG